MNEAIIISDVRAQLNSMEKVIQQNLYECCKEIDHMRQTGELSSGGFVRQAAAQLTDDTFKGRQLVHAENCVNKLAIGFVIAYYL